jgi:hypothetical protein
VEPKTPPLRKVEPKTSLSSGVMKYPFGIRNYEANSEVYGRVYLNKTSGEIFIFASFNLIASS